MNKYRRLQTIKHALQHYITRPNADPKDIEQEKVLLDQIKEDIRSTKSKWYGTSAKK
ncbi:hypothetical protein [Acetobacterium woodii]|uniref:Uncharacterized protein n=1 Tax=Acetobacterium woodii (strain ATCC 29683 / DSM 1030 / JCM 2381 / KCTC 1655 / WB1) TaxID=931626 RepID=H6LIV3_ACEWD|nr:hypothetical protein [Acetobacterium woodii]AFA49842.1 hypothetical protein Awo_c31140 [Acetobacterium woodii DSM 1030]